MAQHLSLCLSLQRSTLLPALLLLALLSTGCQSHTMLVDSLPPPNLNGPEILPAPVAVAPHPAAVLPLPAPRIARAPLGIPRDWMPVASARPWKYIVIHHSATPTGSAAVFDRMHKEKGWDELGYHFVIGNGTQSGNGQVEVGPRWPIQKHGAHAKTPDNRYNDFGIGICLVGNFEETNPTPQQMRSLAKLVAFLMQTYHIPPSGVIGHRDTKSTACPGRNLDIFAVRRMAGQVLVDAGQLDPAAVDTASAATPDELLTDTKSAE